MAVSNDMLLMLEDIVVMRINFDTAKYEVVSESQLPWSLKGKIRKVIDFNEVKSRYDDTQRQIAINANRDAVAMWLSRRVLPLSRKNAKWIFNMYKFPQEETVSNKMRIALVCRAVSLLDNYWVKMENDDVKWADVNIRTNPLNEIVAQVALHGRSLTLQGSLTSPELTTHGAYAKAWKREDNDLWLYKMGAKDPTESKIEVMVSNILDKTTAKHVRYFADESEGVYCCKCKCMTTEDFSILSGSDFYSYCCANGLDYDKEMIRLDSDGIYTMWIVDYLIANRDRHGLNWGYFYNALTMEILGCHLLYDHNNAFDKDWMQDEDAEYQFGNMTIKEAAMYAMKRVDFHFTDDITRDDFMTTMQYETFMKRAKQLGVKTIKDDGLNSAIDKLGNL